MPRPAVSSVSADKAEGGAAGSSNDQSSGDLQPFIRQLQSHITVLEAGTMSLPSLLSHLQSAAPEVFAQFDRFVEAARRVSGLDEMVAQQCKVQGNEAYAAAQLQQAVQIYTQGLLCAASDDTVATLLNNRSTAFFELRNYAAACLDADRALTYKPEYWKAMQRRGRALEELGMQSLGRNDCDAAAAQDARRANSRATMQRLLGQNTAHEVLPPRLRVQAAIALADGAATARGGVVATTRLDCGPVVEEQPYAVVARMEALLSVCAYCLQPTTCLYQGDEYRRAGVKSRGLFCSEGCATKSWNYFGQRESRNAFFLCCPNDALLAWRVLGMLDAFPDYADALDDDVAAANDTAALKAQLGAAAHNLHVRLHHCTHTRELDPKATVGGVESVVAVLGLYMNALTAAEAEAVRWAQRGLLAHAVNVSFTLQLSDSAATRSGGTHSDTTVVPGRAVYALLPHFAHSCDPNCFLSFVGNPQGCSATAVVRAVRPIMEGEALTIAYDGVTRFQFHSLRHRLQTLRERYGFVCHCKVCTNQVDEPVYEEKEHYVKAADFYHKGRRLTREGNYRAAVTVLLQSYEIIMRYICPPPRPPQSMLLQTHDALALAYYKLGNAAKAAEHLRAHLALYKEIHGTDNRPEVITYCARLALLVPDVEERARYVNQAVELLTRFYAPSPTQALQITSLRAALKEEPRA